jgi:hypothetical protein
MKRIIFSDALARALSISENDLYELAGTRQLPFAVTSASPRQLVISAQDLPAWRRAAEDFLPH